MSHDQKSQTPGTEDTVTINDAGGRRRFIRTGAAYLVAGAVVTTTTAARADDCDRGSQDSEMKKQVAGSDSDTGDTADRAGCGRRAPETPARLKQPAPQIGHSASQASDPIKRIKG